MPARNACLLFLFLLALLSLNSRASAKYKEEWMSGGNVTETQAITHGQDKAVAAGNESVARAKNAHQTQAKAALPDSPFASDPISAFADDPIAQFARRPSKPGRL